MLASDPNLHASALDLGARDGYISNLFARNFAALIAANPMQLILLQSAFVKHAFSGGIILCAVLCLWGAASDRAYKKAGGVRPSAEAKSLLVETIVASFAFLFALSLGKHGPGIVGNFAAILSVVIFGTWEIFRLRIRQKQPIHK